MFTEETYPQQATVDETFTGTHTLELSDGKTVELSELSQSGVSSTQTVALIPELNALIVGDLVHHKLHAWLEGGIVNGQATPTIEGWIADLQELETTFGGDPEPTVYGGRGEPRPSRKPSPTRSPIWSAPTRSSPTMWPGSATDVRAERRERRGALCGDPGRAGGGIPRLRLPRHDQLQCLWPGQLQALTGSVSCARTQADRGPAARLLDPCLLARTLFANS